MIAPVYTPAKRGMEITRLPDLFREVTFCERIFESREETFAFALLESGVEFQRRVETVIDCLLDRVLAQARGEAFAVTFGSLFPLLWRVIPLGNTRRCCRTQQPLWSNSAFDVTIKPLARSWKM